MGPNTSSHDSCAAKLNGEMFIFGGNGTGQNKQVPKFFSANFSLLIKISKITDCALKRIAELPNEFRLGACGTYLFSKEERVMFCFPETGKNKCFR